MNTPKVTIAVPTINRLAYLRLSLQSALLQTYSNLEVIVSDNCSSDGTVEYLESLSDPRLLVLRQSTNLGMIGNWNAILEKATGEFFLLLSDDDLLDKHAIEKLVAPFVSSTDPEKIAFSYCRSSVIDSNGRTQSIGGLGVPIEAAREFVIRYFRLEREMRLCATLLRTSDIREVGGFTQGSVVLAVDAIVWSRILQKRRSASFVPEVLASYRLHASSTSISNSIGTWQKDLRQLTAFWVEDFRGAPSDLQRELRDAARTFEAAVIAGTINLSAGSYSQRLGLLKTYYRCRSSFVGIAGVRKLIPHLLMLLIPPSIKAPIRGLLVRFNLLYPPA